ncbi:hypothetical protein H4R20_002203 [Coemansia guatemalensis]|uniref:Chitin-binding type-4 domain-containing protein n=1 Tax=Coemansia guatemalensis TaxID=2761395 RepID=A0A9W8LV86_9FUNG|nr:hypothetical protein H4R20_002203 [Coemansia guatemalensis]
MLVRQTLGYIVGMALAASANGHVSLKSPCVRYTPFCDSCPELPSGQSLDQNINAPIGTHDSISQPLCKYTTPYSRPAVEWTAGTTVDIEFRDHAAVHGGGHCQFALSYDGGKTFVVIHDELKYCFVGGPSSSNTATQLSYSIPLPADLPSGDKVVFAWAWNNAIGNREFYMNCADVAIKGSGTSFSGPEMLVANYGPDSPYIPEFNGDYETAMDLYNARKTITVNGSGGGGASPGAPGNSTSSPGGYSAEGSSAAPGATSPASDYNASGSGPGAPGAPTSGEGAPGEGSAPGAPTGGEGAPGEGSAPGAPTDTGSNPSGGYSAPGMGSAPGSPDTPTGADTAAPAPEAPTGAGSPGYASGPGGEAEPTSTAPAYNGVAPPSPFSTAPADFPAAGGYASSPVPAAPPVYHARVAPIPAPAPPSAPTTSKCT